MQCSTGTPPCQPLTSAVLKSSKLACFLEKYDSYANTPLSKKDQSFTKQLHRAARLAMRDSSGRQELPSFSESAPQSHLRIHSQPAISLADSNLIMQLQSRGNEPHSPSRQAASTQTRDRAEQADHKQQTKFKEEIRTVMLDCLTNDSFMKGIREGLLQALQSSKDDVSDSAQDILLKQELKRKAVRKIYKELRRNYSVGEESTVETASELEWRLTQAHGEGSSGYRRGLRTLLLQIAEHRLEHPKLKSD